LPALLVTFGEVLHEGKMAKIALIDLVINFPPHGGASTDVLQIGSRLAEEHEVRLFIPSFKSKAYNRCKLAPGFPLQVCRVEFTPWSFNWREAPRRFSREVDSFRPDVVFLADGWYLKPYLVHALQGYPLVLRLYAHELLCTKGKGYFHRWGRICQRDHLRDSILSVAGCKLCTLWWILRHHNRVFGQEFLLSLAVLPRFREVVVEAIQRADQIIVYNHSIKGRIEEFNPRVWVVPSGVDTELFAPANDSPSQREMRLLMVGGVDDPYKGFHILRSACRKLIRQGFRISLMVTSHRRFPDGFIHSLGWLTPSQLAEVYRGADICVVPSIWPEPQGIVALEAMASAKPLVVSDVGGLKEIVKDGVSGLLFKPGDPDDLACKLTRLIEKPELRRELGKRGREEAVTKYRWDVIYQTYYKKVFSAL